MRSRTIHSLDRFHLILAILSVTLVLGCDSSDPDPDPGPTNRGSGTLVLGDDTHDFDVIVCDFSGEADDQFQTLMGRGTTADGQEFEVFASRNQIDEMLTHTVSYQTGNVASGGGTIIQAQRLRMNGTWSNLLDEPDEPLIQISGNTLTASGVFTINDNLDDTVDGQITATCE